MNRIIKAENSDCKKGELHRFKIISSANKKKRIREELPKFIYPLWECIHCDKITQST